MHQLSMTGSVHVTGFEDAREQPEAMSLSSSPTAAVCPAASEARSASPPASQVASTSGNASASGLWNRLPAEVGAGG